MATETDKRKAIRVKLDAYLKDIPEYGGQVLAGTPVLPKREMTEKTMAAARKSNSTDARFRAYTKIEHIDLLENWWANGNKTGNRTSCNDFCCHVGYHLGAKMNLGLFEIDSVLRSMGKGHAWVPAVGSNRPKYGDIFRATALHMGVSLDCASGGWWTVEAGQGGGNSTGVDAIKRKVEFYNPVAVRGWVDMELFLDPRPPVPEWLLGWWVMYEGKDVYYYYFDQYHKVSYAPMTVQAATPVQFVAVETVDFRNPDYDTVEIAWEGGTLETLKHDFDSFPGLMEKMSGTTKPPYGLPGGLKGVRL